MDYPFGGKVLPSKGDKRYVAILVLVDYPFGESNKIITNNEILVAILVLVDYPFGVKYGADVNKEFHCVAILVLVDYPFGDLPRPTCPENFYKGRNPCSSGLSFRSIQLRTFKGKKIRRNPCSSGLSFRSNSPIRMKRRWLVAILVLVDYPFGDY